MTLIVALIVVALIIGVVYGAWRGVPAPRIEAYKVEPTWEITYPTPDYSVTLPSGRGRARRARQAARDTARRNRRALARDVRRALRHGRGLSTTTFARELSRIY